ncbi:MAG: phytoene desaturase [Alphaproteobacteria bacterium]|nr:phytoene desaturase [Alphaproteobacteria bacterium]
MLTQTQPPPSRQAPDPPDARGRAVILGAGFGGLAAAVRLQARGYRVTVLERQAGLGGRAMVHELDGFRFDAGPTIITAPFLLEELWTLAGKRLSDHVALRVLDPFYTLSFADGLKLSAGSADSMRAQIARFAPGDLAGYDRFLDRARAIYEIGFEQLADQPFSSIMDMARIAPHLVRLGGLTSVHDLIATYVKDPRLQMALSFHPLFIGGDPFRASALYALIVHLEQSFGVHYPMGGVGALVQGLADLITGAGGEIHTDAEAAEILVRDGRAAGVRLTDGRSFDADVVVSNVDAAQTYGRLLRTHRRARWTDGRLRRARQSMSVFVWYFGTRKRYDHVGHHTILFGPRYRGLIEDIFRRRVLADDMSLYLHRPSATDPTCAPPGCDAFYVLSPVPNLAADIDWTLEAEPYRRRIAARLSQTLLPDLESNIAASRLLTPLGFRDDLLSAQGAAFGFEPLLTQSAWFRPHNRSEELDGLYLVGAGAHPGAGVPGVLSSARILDRVVPHAHALVS